MPLKLPAHPACVVFRRLGSWFPGENRAFGNLTYGKSAARGGVSVVSLHFYPLAFRSSDVARTPTEDGRPPTERVTPRCEELLFDNTTCAEGERRGNAYSGITDARE